MPLSHYTLQVQPREDLERRIASAFLSPSSIRVESRCADVRQGFVYPRRLVSGGSKKREVATFS